MSKGKKSEITFSCGHSSTVTFFCTSAEYEKQKAKIAAGRCAACERRETEALNAAFVAEKKLPEIKAEREYNDKTHLRNANTNRREVLLRMEEALKQPESGSTSLPEAYKNLCEETSARFWLENRYEIEQAIRRAITSPLLTELTNEETTVSGPVYIVRPKRPEQKKKDIVWLRVSSDTVYLNYNMEDESVQDIMFKHGFQQDYFGRDILNKKEEWEKRIKFQYRSGIIEETCADVAIELLNKGFTVALPSKEIKDMI